MKKIKCLIVVFLVFFVFVQGASAESIGAKFITGVMKGISKTVIHLEKIPETAKEYIEKGEIAVKAIDETAKTVKEKTNKSKTRSEKTEIIESTTKFKCSDVKYLTSAWLFIRIAAPFIIILFGSLDFLKAVAAGDEKKMQESKGNFIKRLIAFLLLILLPFVVQLIFTSMGTYGSNNVCLLKCITTNDTSDKGCD